LVSQGGVRPEFEHPTAEQKTKVIDLMESGYNKHAAYIQAGVRITSGHVFRNEQICTPEGVLYRIDEARRGE
jgi:hypothetical protein